MPKLIIEGGKKLDGSIPVYGSKNAALPLLAAALLTDKTIKLSNIPEILDVENMVKILRSLGGQIDHAGTNISLNFENLSDKNIDDDLVGSLRGSILLMGPLLGRLGKVVIHKPGGDIIGARPIDTHLDAFYQLGAKIEKKDGNIELDGSDLKAGEVVLREFSVTATENVMMLASLIPGKTTIHMAATEPHVVALGELLNLMGAKVTGAGTHTLTIEGTKELKGADFENIPDMLEAGLFILMGAATQSNLVVENVPIDHLTLFFKKLDDIGVNYTLDREKTTVTIKPAELKSFSMQSLPYPGIATDLQAPFSVVASQATGSSLIHDPMYESRFKHIAELQKMGATVTVCDPHRVIVSGKTALHGSEISSLDIRSGATLVLAALIAEGETTIDEANIIDRGYSKLVERLTAIGANIKKVG